MDDEQLDGVDPKTKAKGVAKAAPVRRRRGFARMKKTSGYKYASEAFGAYLPLLLVFFLVFTGVWVWISFGPHAPTPQQNWTRIDSAWFQKRQADRQKVMDAPSDFTSQMDGWKAVQADTKGWMDALRAVSADGWDGPRPSLSPDETYSNSNLVTQLVQAGDDELTTLDAIVAATTLDQVASVGSGITVQEQTLATEYFNARTQIMGIQAPASAEPTLGLPSICPSASDSAWPSASSSASANLSASPSPSASPSRASSSSPLASSSLLASPSSSGSAAAPSPDVCASALPSASASSSASVVPSGSLGPSGSPSTSAKS